MTSTVDPAEIEHFSRMAGEWWDAHGKFKPLHQMNPARIAWIRDRVAERKGGLRGLRLLDIGCGGGLMTEPMCRLGAAVTAIDAAEKNIAVAQLHAEQAGLAIDYRCQTAEALAEESPGAFDVVLALEIVEHVADLPLFLASIARLLKPGGLAFLSTLNRTPRSYAMAIMGAELLLRWLPRGTHDWRKFLKPHELAEELARHGLRLSQMTGMVYHPFSGEWRLDAGNMAVNYMVMVEFPA